jgi:glycerol-3-phosphate dehydrogenase
MHAILVPRTRDGRVMFAIPWHGHTLVGTTDTPVERPTLEPHWSEDEVGLILDTAGRYLHKAPVRADVLSAFVGIRPLVSAGGSASTAALSRDHIVHIDASGLVTATGGKWTTYRHMAEDTLDRVAPLGRLPERVCVTRTLPIHGFDPEPARHGRLSVYGSDAPAIQRLADADPSMAEQLHPALPYIGAEVAWVVRHEMARTVEDVLARRLRALFLNARAAQAMAPRVARVMAPELGRDERWQRDQLEGFQQVAANYVV